MAMPAELVERPETPQLTTALAVQQPDAPITTQMEMSIPEALTHLQRLREFVSKVLVEGQDYGKIPGAGDKKTLFKSGGEALCEIYALTIEVAIVKAIERWDDLDPLFAYDCKTTLISRRTGQKVAEGIGHANSREAKFRYRWVFKNELPEGVDPATCVKKNFKNKKTGKTFLKYRLLNEDPFSLVNTIQKMAAKRSFVDAVLKATRSSGILTQDLEDLRDNGVIGADDEEGEDSEEGEAQAAPSRPVSEAQLKRLFAIGKGKGLNSDQVAEWVQEHFGCKPSELLTNAHKLDDGSWTDSASYGEACRQLEAADAAGAERKLLEAAQEVLDGAVQGAEEALRAAAQRAKATTVPLDRAQAARQKAVADAVKFGASLGLTPKEIAEALAEPTGFESPEAALAGGINRYQVEAWQEQMQLLADQKSRKAKAPNANLPPVDTDELADIKLDGEK